jgi:hypothetical protein
MRNHIRLELPPFCTPRMNINGGILVGVDFKDRDDSSRAAEKSSASKVPPTYTTRKLNKIVTKITAREINCNDCIGCDFTG